MFGQPPPFEQDEYAGPPDTPSLHIVDRLLELLWLSIGTGPHFGPSIGWNLCCQINAKHEDTLT